QECDFEGRSTQPDQLNATSTHLVSLMAGCEEQHLVFTGLANEGQDLEQLSTTVHFSVNSGRQVVRPAGPMLVGQDGLIYAAVKYPSMEELWPDVYETHGVRTVQVDVYVMIRSGDCFIRYPGTEVKV
ncbi:unnamed protein product, partial [Scytosiphon promiscuus]